MGKSKRPRASSLAAAMVGKAALAVAAAAPTSMPAPADLPAVAELPNPFVFRDGRPLRDPNDWPRRRAELLEMILHYEYGPLPPRPEKTVGTELASREGPGGSTRRQFRLTAGAGEGVSFALALTVPKGTGPFAVVLRGDLCWGAAADDIAAEVVRRGYILAEFDRTRVAPDAAGRDKGIYAACRDWHGGALSAWAWGFHRCVDFLTALPVVDARRIAVTGHSRGGKAALLAGATDERIALTAPNNSGCGGAGCFRFQAPGSEDIAAITKRFPFWFARDFGQFVGRVEKLPFDQHSLKAAVAPRALLSSEALGDLWANPEGTWHTYRAAREVYRFLGAADRIGIVYRPGGHKQGLEDWAVLLDFADRELMGRKVRRDFQAPMFADSPSPFSWSAPARAKQ